MADSALRRSIVRPGVRFAQALQRRLYSDRPRWAMMPGHVASNFVDSLLFVLSLLDRLEIANVAHYGTLLGAAHLSGVAPWDEDADIFAIGVDFATLHARLVEPLAQHGFELRWTPRRDALLIRQRPWFAGQGHIGLCVLPWVLEDHEDPTRMEWDVFMRRSELYPLRRYPYYSSHVMGPAQAEPVLSRLYGASGSAAAMCRFVAPPIAPACSEFWARARPLVGPSDFVLVSQRFRARARALPWHAATFPWWWWNGAHNLGVQGLRRVGRALEQRIGGGAAQSG